MLDKFAKTGEQMVGELADDILRYEVVNENNVIQAWFSGEIDGEARNNNKSTQKGFPDFQHFKSWKQKVDEYTECHEMDVLILAFRPVRANMKTSIWMY